MLDVVRDESTAASHEMSAVDEGEAFLCGEGEGLDACTLEDGCGWNRTTVDDDVAFTDEDIGDRGEWGEVTRCTDGAELGDRWRDSRVEELNDGLRNDWADAGEASGKRGGEEEHGAADDVGGEGGADSGMVRANEVGLKSGEIFVIDATFGEGAEAGIDAVVGFTIGKGGFDDFA